MGPTHTPHTEEEKREIGHRRGSACGRGLREFDAVLQELAKKDSELAKKDSVIRELGEV